MHGCGSLLYHVHTSRYNLLRHSLCLLDSGNLWSPLILWIPCLILHLTLECPSLMTPSCYLFSKIGGFGLGIMHLTPNLSNLYTHPRFHLKEISVHLFSRFAWYKDTEWWTWCSRTSTWCFWGMSRIRRYYWWWWGPHIHFKLELPIKQEVFATHRRLKTVMMKRALQKPMRHWSEQ